jgi:hypothetical protein
MRAAACAEGSVLRLMSTSGPRNLSLVVLTLLVGGASACGGGATPSDPKQTVAEFVDALKDQDANAACDALTQKSRQLAARGVHADSCVDAFIPRSAAGFDQAKVGRTTFLSGRRAEVRVTNVHLDSGVITYSVVKTDQGWKIDLRRTRGLAS